ncbi:MAG: DUF3524 domain-containing protein [Desulfobulbaceae bacterium]|nr:DUF3524 domain-containing protein [Desulfobulbaceae bacterium]
MLQAKPHFLLIEPYYGGSHRAFLDGLQQYLDCDFTLLTLPARKWKMRMQLAAPWIAEKVIALVKTGKRYDGLLCSTFLDVAVLRSQLFRAGVKLPVAVYFHENQFGYPGQVADPGQHQFTAINFTSAVTADFLAFNSRYNFDTFLSGVGHYLKKAADMELQYLAETVALKSEVLYPGIDFRAIDMEAKSAQHNNIPVIVWNHRWEHDKDPETFFASLVEIAGKDIPFQLIVLGQHFHNQPEIFAWARERLKEQIIHFGYAESREEYARLLARGDIVASTALHEFFGMAILEGVRAGCRPLVPDRLSYTELFPDQYRYRDGQLVRSLQQLLGNREPFSYKESGQLTERFSWPATAGAYENWLMKMMEWNLPE